MKSTLPLLLVTSVILGCQSQQDNPFVFESFCEEAVEQDFKPLTFTVDVAQKQAKVNGVICSGSYDAFEEMTESYPNIKLLRISEIPGSADDETNLRLSKKIHEMGISTYLGSDGIVESGGTDLLLSGVTRKVEKGAKVGVHSWAFEDDNGNLIGGSELPKSSVEHKPYIEYYQDVGLSKPEEFYWFTMQAAPAEDIYYLTPQELDYFGFNSPSFAF